MSNETWWGEAKPGDTVYVGGPEKNEIMIGVNLPDWVRLPPELGGQQLKVVGDHYGPCPKNNQHEAHHIFLDGNINVAECVTCKEFIWYSGI